MPYRASRTGKTDELQTYTSEQRKNFRAPADDDSGQQKAIFKNKGKLTCKNWRRWDRQLRYPTGDTHLSRTETLKRTLTVHEAPPTNHAAMDGRKRVRHPKRKPSSSKATATNQTFAMNFSSFRRKAAVQRRDPQAQQRQFFARNRELAPNGVPKPRHHRSRPRASLNAFAHQPLQTAGDMLKKADRNKKKKRSMPKPGADFLTLNLGDEDLLEQMVPQTRRKRRKEQENVARRAVRPARKAKANAKVDRVVAVNAESNSVRVFENNVEKTSVAHRPAFQADLLATLKDRPLPRLKPNGIRGYRQRRQVKARLPTTREEFSSFTGVHDQDDALPETQRVVSSRRHGNGGDMAPEYSEYALPETQRVVSSRRHHDDGEIAPDYSQAPGTKRPYSNQSDDNGHEANEGGNREDIDEGDGIESRHVPREISQAPTVRSPYWSHKPEDEDGAPSRPMTNDTASPVREHQPLSPMELENAMDKRSRASTPTSHSFEGDDRSPWEAMNVSDDDEYGAPPSPQRLEFPFPVPAKQEVPMRLEDFSAEITAIEDRLFYSPDRAAARFKTKTSQRAVHFRRLPVVQRVRVAVQTSEGMEEKDHEQLATGEAGPMLKSVPRQTFLEGVKPAVGIHPVESAVVVAAFTGKSPIAAASEITGKYPQITIRSTTPEVAEVKNSAPNAN